MIVLEAIVTIRKVKGKGKNSNADLQKLCKKANVNKNFA